MKGCDGVVVLGAGPGGLTAAYWLLQQGIKVIVVEREMQVGGLMRPVQHDGFMVDYGYKQLYTRIPEVHQLWQEILGADYLPYLPRIGVLYEGHVLEKEKSFRGLRRGMPYRLLVAGCLDLIRCKFGNGARQMTSKADQAYAARGRLFTKIFSQEYDERFRGKQWSASPPAHIQKQSLLRRLLRRKPRASLWQPQWFHPARGTGQIIERMVQKIASLGGEIWCGCTVVGMLQGENRVQSITVEREGRQTHMPVKAVISSLPIQSMAALLHLPCVPSDAEVSFSRGVVMVYVFLDCPVAFEHTMLQVSCPKLKMARVSNYAAFGGRMVPKGKGCLCIEYFTSSAAELFPLADAEIAAFALSECEQAGLVKRKYCAGTVVFKHPHSDPATSWEDYAVEPSRMAVYKQLSQFENLYQIHRTGLDKSTFAGLRAADAILKGNRAAFDRSTRPDAFAPWRD